AKIRHAGPVARIRAETHRALRHEGDPASAGANGRLGIAERGPRSRGFRFSAIVSETQPSQDLPETTGARRQGVHYVDIQDDRQSWSTTRHDGHSRAICAARSAN